MILMTLFIAGFWNRPPKLKARRTGRCVCNSCCFENHMECLLNSEVWNSILILSCLSALLPMADGHAMQALRELQSALEATEHLFNRSDARLYTPNTEDINDCTYKLFDCFLMEMNVLLHEEDSNLPMIEKTLEVYGGTHCKKTYYCEQELTNPMVFFERMKTFLQKMSSVCQGKQNVPCD
ncbi:interleukin-15 [Siphateles boraxobius]|uniref:interleukin-15 n=1 Tax=Siphateles boraxobius TaxID=180520 RepID=UPI00406439E5